MEENKNITENTTTKEESAATATPAAEAPKKKKPAIVFRPQNQETAQAGRGRRPAGSAAGTRATTGTSTRQAGSASSSTPSSGRTLKAAVEKKETVPASKVVAEPVTEAAATVKPEETKKAPAVEAEPVKAVEPAEVKDPVKTEETKAETAKTEPEAAPSKVEEKAVKETAEAAPAAKPEFETRKRIVIHDNRNSSQRTFGQNRDSRPSGDGRNNGGQRRFNSDGQNGNGGYAQRSDRPSGGYQGRRDGNGNGRPFDRNGQQGQQGGGYRGRNDAAFDHMAKDKDADTRPAYSKGNGNRKTTDSLGRQISSLDMSPVNAKNSDNRKAKDFARKDKDKDKSRFEQPKKTENTKNLSKSMKNKKPQETAPAAPVEKKEDEIRTLTLPDVITIKDLADMMKVQASALVKTLFLKGMMVTINSEIDFDQAEEIAMDYNCICEHEVKVDVIEELLKDIEDPEDSLIPRPPVVCVMGHVDHGKTSLLDAIRKTNVTSREAGGITQHIGASVVECNGQKITFLDTPGHEAFTAMRMRGAQSTDIAILVVAADDGVMPQTVEAINHAKAAGVEIIVAINKIDKPSANIERVKQELTEYELVSEDWGGKTIFAPVSAKSGEGIDNLLEMVLLAADIHELKANPNRKARGLVIEAKLDKGRGPVATVLVQKGTLHVGENIAIGSCYGKIRAMIDDTGRRVKEATPSTPVEILGLNDVPNAGDIFVCHDNEREARTFAETFIREHKKKLIEETKAKLTMDSLFTQIQAGNVKELNIIIKADVQGSVEAVRNSLEKLSNEEVAVKTIHGGVGAINESDVMLAAASNAIIIGFNVRPEPAAKLSAEHEGIDMRLYSVIYQAIEEMESAMKGMLDPIFEEKILGHAVVRQIFKASQVGTIAGSYVTEGIITRGCSCRIFREGEQIFEGPLTTLKRFKDDVKEVKEGFECGLNFEKFNDIKEDDTIEAYTMVEVAR